MRRRFTVGREFIVSFNRALIILRISRSHFKKNVRLAAHRFTFFRRARGGGVQNFIIERGRIPRLAQLALDHRLLVARRKFQFPIELNDSIAFASNIFCGRNKWRLRSAFALLLALKRLTLPV